MAQRTWVQEGTVQMANNNDPYYTELESFVAYLLLKADGVWPNRR